MSIQQHTYFGSCSWALEIFKKIWIQTSFGLMMVDFVEVSWYVAFLRHGCILAIFVALKKWVLLHVCIKKDPFNAIKATFCISCVRVHMGL